MQKTELRRSLLQQRQSLSQSEWHHKSNQICHYLTNATVFQNANTILSYFSIKQEPDLSSLISQLPSKQWGAPRCVGSELVWHLLPSDRTSLQPGAYGIPEPHPDFPQLACEQVDLILVPCVGCDRNGYRLGYGGGYYDRLLSDPQWATKPTIGIVFDFAILTDFTPDPWDQPLSAICSESELIQVSPHGS